LNTSVTIREKIRELYEELRTVFAGRGGWVDSLLPPTIYILGVGLVGTSLSLVAALLAALLITIVRLLKRQALQYALGGLGGVLLAVALTRLLGRAEGFFLPGIITGGATVGLALLSILLRRPMVAWTSYLTRRWPRAWYWHPQVRPAYTEVTWLWVGYFSLRLLLQFSLFQEEAAALLGIINLLTGWPGTIVLLLISYLYGLWRLQQLGGPSVEEFETGALPPWTGQRRGF
jgi:hypothetical protein